MAREMLVAEEKRVSLDAVTLARLLLPGDCASELT